MAFILATIISGVLLYKNRKNIDMNHSSVLPSSFSKEQVTKTLGGPHYGYPSEFVKDMLVSANVRNRRRMGAPEQGNSLAYNYRFPVDDARLVDGSNRDELFKKTGLFKRNDQRVHYEEKVQMYEPAMLRPDRRSTVPTVGKAPPMRESARSLCITLGKNSQEI